MSLILFPMSIGCMSHVDFKKWPCRPVDFKGQGPYYRPVDIDPFSAFHSVIAESSRAFGLH